MAESELLNVKDLRVEYTTDDALIYALNGVDLSLKKGETLGLVGETGAGKTTLAMSILRLLPKNVGSVKAGAIEFDGVNLLEEKESHMLRYRGKRISIIFQDPMTSLNPLMRVGDQVAEIIQLHNDKGMSEAQIDQRVDELFAMVPKSWVMRIMDVPNFCLRSFIRCKTWAWMVTSKAVVGSSAISSSGSQAREIAMTTRCFMPPEN